MINGCPIQGPDSNFKCLKSLVQKIKIQSPHFMLTVYKECYSSLQYKFHHRFPLLNLCVLMAIQAEKFGIAANLAEAFSTPGKIRHPPTSISKVRVIVRLRPFLPQEISSRKGNPVSCVSLHGSGSSFDEVTLLLKDQETRFVIWVLNFRKFGRMILCNSLFFFFFLV